jgi:hypothetical protein
MKPASVVLLALLFGSIPLSGQYGTAGMEHMDQTQTSVIHLPPVLPLCPVSLRAKQTAAGDLLAVDNSHPKGPAQRLHLILNSRDSRRITGATVTVRGLTAKGRVTRALSALSSQDDASDAARTLEVTFTPGLHGEVSGDLRIPDLTAVLTIDLDSITYADGSTWKLSPGKSCRTVPDPAMLIGSR